MKENDFIDYLNSNLTYNTNYSKIKNNISINMSCLNKQKKKVIYKFLKISLFILTICLFCIFTTSFVIKKSEKTNEGTINTDDDDSGYIPYPGKVDPDSLLNIFDKFFAYGPYTIGGVSLSKLYTYSMINESNILSDEDEKILYNYAREYNYRNKFVIYMGVIDEIDTILIIDAYFNKFMYFKSNLDYKFQDVIDKFESITNKKITNDFLTASRINEFEIEAGGITLMFTREYNPYYVIWIENTYYTVYMDE